MATEVDFGSVAEYLQHPLVLIGFGLFLLFGFFRAILNSGLLKQATRATSGELLGQIIRFGFVLALLLMVLGFALQFFQIDRNTEHAERRAVLAEEAKAEAMDMARSAMEVALSLASGSDISPETLAQIEEAVDALAAQDRPGVDEALAQLAEGDTSQAKDIFRDVVDTREGDIREAAAALRHLGALAFLDDTQEALGAYRRATELEPENPAGWNQLGHLYVRVGELSEAEEAYGRVLELAGSTGAQVWRAVAYGNLGIVYEIRGELDQAEAMYKKSAAIDEELGSREGMAIAYANLGNVYRVRGKLDQAREHWKRALSLFEELGLPARERVRQWLSDLEE